MPRLPRPTLTALAALVLLGTVQPAIPQANPLPPRVDPHLDQQVVTGGCASCHEGHGIPRSPMLPASQGEVCLRCHWSRARADAEIARGNLAPGERPRLLSDSLSQPYTHFMTDGALSSREPGVVTCSSCHSPHRGPITLSENGGVLGQKKPSPRDPTQFEYELCQGCHGSEGLETQSLLDISRLTSLGNRSFHPIEGPAREPSLSVVSALSGQEINCTDCHRDSGVVGSGGPHGSEFPYLLRAQYYTSDGSAESAQSYELCYDCHDRDVVLESSTFPPHALHVVEESASCATCHNAHGSLENRALIRFGGETFIGGVSPSLETGRLAFESSGPGSGLCYLTCHGFDHAPEGYGPEALLVMPAEPGGRPFDPGDVLSLPRGTAGPLEGSSGNARDQRPQDP